MKIISVACNKACASSKLIIGVSICPFLAHFFLATLTFSSERVKTPVEVVTCIIQQTIKNL